MRQYSFQAADRPYPRTFGFGRARTIFGYQSVAFGRWLVTAVVRARRIASLELTVFRGDLWPPNNPNALFRRRESILGMAGYSNGTQTDA